MFIEQQKPENSFKNSKNKSEPPKQQLTEKEEKNVNSIRQAAMNHILPSGIKSTQDNALESGNKQELTQKDVHPIQRQEFEEGPLQSKSTGDSDSSYSNGSEGKDSSNAKASENKTGMPDNLKSGIENLSGYDMSDVRVHKNSDKPSNVGAHAFTQGTEIHLAPGQEKHLPHEAWHAVQQMQGRVKPTTEVGGTSVNDDEGLEKEADTMGLEVLLKKANTFEKKPNIKNSSQEIIQKFNNGEYDYIYGDHFWTWHLSNSTGDNLKAEAKATTNSNYSHNTVINMASLENSTEISVSTINVGGKYDFVMCIGNVEAYSYNRKQKEYSFITDITVHGYNTSRESERKITHLQHTF